MKVNHRMNKLRAYMEKENIKLSIITNPDHQFYLTGFKAKLYSRPITLIISESYSLFIVPGLEEVHAREIAQVDEVIVYYEQPEFEQQGTDYNNKLIHALTGIASHEKVGTDMDYSTLSLGKVLDSLNFKVIDIGQVILEMRYIKDADEINMMKEAGKLTNLAVRKSLESCRKDITEIDMDAHGNKALYSEVANKYPNSTLDIFVMSPSGKKRSTMPHAFSNTRLLQEGDGLIHSRQVGINGYRAELERTIFIGQPTKIQKEVFEIAKNAQELALEYIKPGVKAKDVDLIARNYIQEKGYGKFSVHRSGHGIGISTHEKPYLRFDNELVLQEGMAFSIEPGIYIPDVGGFRHSDTVILTSEGCEVITDYPRDIESLIF